MASETVFINSDVVTGFETVVPGTLHSTVLMDSDDGTYVESSNDGAIDEYGTSDSPSNADVITEYSFTVRARITDVASSAQFQLDLYHSGSVPVVGNPKVVSAADLGGYGNLGEATKTWTGLLLTKVQANSLAVRITVLKPNVLWTSRPLSLGASSQWIANIGIKPNQINNTPVDDARYLEAAAPNARDIYIVTNPAPSDFVTGKTLTLRARLQVTADPGILCRFRGPLYWFNGSSVVEIYNSFADFGQMASINDVIIWTTTGLSITKAMADQYRLHALSQSGNGWVLGNGLIRLFEYYLDTYYQNNALVRVTKLSGLMEYVPTSIIHTLCLAGLFSSERTVAALFDSEQDVLASFNHEIDVVGSFDENLDVVGGSPLCDS